MKIDKANGRDKKRNKRINGMRISGKSVFLTVEILVNKAKKVNKEKAKK